MDSVQTEVEKVYKSAFGKLVSSLLKIFPQLGISTVEDIVHDSFSRALTHWKENGFPDNPLNWLFTVCRNNALNRIKKNKNHVASDFPETMSTSELLTDSMLQDYNLRLLFACAHEDLSPKVQVVLTLKYVANLKAEAIAKAFGMSVDGVDKMLVRARDKIRSERILFKEPGALSLKNRLATVHKIIYLIFNEGYKSNSGNRLIRGELCEEALILNKVLLQSEFANKDTAALYALMLFNSARLNSRFADSGDLIDLENQDRTSWDHDLIRLGAKYLEESKSDNLSSFHLEASIAFLHCHAKDFQSTDWKTISGLYKLLMRANNNPFAAMNYAISMYYAGDKQEAFLLLNELERHPFLNQYYLLNATLGKLNYLEGNFEHSKMFLSKALRQTEFKVEKDFIQKLIDRIPEMDSWQTRKLGG